MKDPSKPACEIKFSGEHNIPFSAKTIIPTEIAAALLEKKGELPLPKRENAAERAGKKKKNPFCRPVKNLSMI